MIIVNIEDWEFELMHSDNYYVYFNALNKFNGDFYPLKIGYHSSFYNWFLNYKKEQAFFIIVKIKNDSYFKIRNPHGNERIKIKNKYPEYFL